MINEPRLGIGIAEPLATFGRVNAESVLGRRDAIDSWGAALARGDDDEIERLVRRSRSARVEKRRIGRLGLIVDRADQTASRIGFE